MKNCLTCTGVNTCTQCENKYLKKDSSDCVDICYSEDTLSGTTCGD